MKICFILNSINTEVHSNSHLIKKYENIKDLSLKMRKIVYAKRPDCDRIIQQKCNWGLKGSELDSIVQDKFLQEFKTDNSNSFARLMIFKKLSLLYSQLRLPGWCSSNNGENNGDIVEKFREL